MVFPLPSRPPAGALAVAVLLSCVGRASADPPPAAPLGASTMAESLFREALTLMDQGAYARACPKLEESERLDPGGGTILNLARCYEGEGRIASAWAAYREGLGYANRDHRDERVRFARERLESLEPRLPKLVLRLPSEAAEGLTLFVDDLQLGAAALDAPQPVDPGVHKIRATAPGRQDYSTTVKLVERESREIAIPPLAPAAPDSNAPNWSAPTPPPVRESSDGSTQRILGGTTFGVGAAAVVTGVVFGLLALDANSTANSLCPGNNPCGDSNGVSASERAHSFGTVSTVSLIAGAVLVIGGGVVFLTAHPSRPVKEP